MQRFIVPLCFALVTSVLSSQALAQNARRTTAHPAAVRPAQPAQQATSSGEDDIAAINAQQHGSTAASDDNGYGSGAGRGLRGRGTAGPRITLYPEPIRHTVLAHLAEVSHCYDRYPAVYDPATYTWMNPDDRRLHVDMHFVIAYDGSVSEASMRGATMQSVEPLGNCVASAIRTWRFPVHLNGGITEVNYPFVFDLVPAALPARRSARSMSVAPRPTS